MAKKLSKKTWKNIGLGCLAGVLGIGAVMGVGALLNREEDLTKTINPTYAVGGLTEDGRYLETEGSIYTKNAFECQGLDVTLDFDNNVSYRIFFYDEDTDFISATEKQTGNYDETTTPVFARYARIVITPNDDDKISIFEKNGYAKQLTIEVNKEQNFEIENLFKLKKVGYVYSNQVGTNLKDESTLIASENRIIGELIDVSNISKVQIITSVAYESRPVMFTDADGIVLVANDLVFEEMEDGKFIAYVNVPSNAKYLGIFSNLGDDLPIVNAIAYR